MGNLDETTAAGARGEPAEAVADPRQEIRIGLVLYGGVSLAIYIYGVVYELWRLARASRGQARNAYTELLQRQGVRATVDIVSGASAGGVNGVLLAKALVTGGDLGRVRSIWVDRADLGGLLRDPREREARSLLRSELFERYLREALAELDRPGGSPAVDVFDLFAPGTRLDFARREYRDDFGSVVQAREYRKIFHLKYRTKGYNPADRTLGYDRNDFGAERNETLVDVARATSAFPAALEPKRIGVTDANRDQFPRTPGLSEPEITYFSDGGITHNKPFSEAISTILTRAADRPVRRWLLSVEPDPEHYELPPKREAPPEVVEVVSKAVVGIPRYETIAADLDRLFEHRVAAGRVRTLLESIDRLAATAAGELSSLTAEEFGKRLEGQLLHRGYRALRREALATSLAGLVGRAAGTDASDEPLVELAVRNHLDGQEDALETLDSAFELRRVYTLLGAADRLISALEPDDRERLRPQYRRLWAEFDRVLDVRWRAVQGEGGAIEAAVVSITGRLAAGLETVRADTRAACIAFDAAFAALDVDAGERSGLLACPLALVFDRFELWDMFLFPIEEVTGSTSRDWIGFARISPADARFVRKPVDQKVAGDTLGHFGGFLSREWRQNDILWGRLDAAEVIARVVLDQPATFADDDPRGEALRAAIRSVQAEIFAEEKPDVGGDYRYHLENEYRVGEQTLASIPVHERVSHVLRGAEVFRNMLGTIKQSQSVRPRALRPVFGWIGAALGFVLGVLRWPVLAIWGRDALWRRAAAVVVFFPAGWALVSLVLVLVFDLFEATDRFWIAVGVAMLPFAAWCAIQAVRRLR